MACQESRVPKRKTTDIRVTPILYAPLCSAGETKLMPAYGRLGADSLVTKKTDIL